MTLSPPLSQRARPLIGLLALLSQSALAKIPTNVAPTKGDDGTILEVIFSYAYDIVLYGGTILIGVCAMVFISHLWGVYSEMRQGKKEKKDFLADLILGAVLLLASIWILNWALDVLSGV